MPKQPVKLAACQTLVPNEARPDLTTGLQDYDEWLIAAYKENMGHYPLSYPNADQLLYNPRTKAGKLLLKELLDA